MNRVKLPGIVIAIVLSAVATGGCGSKDAVANRIQGATLRIYTSGPMRGASRLNAQAVVNGEELALSQAGEKVGHYRIQLRALDDSTPQRDEWDPGKTTVNARIVIQDPTTIGYIGDFNSGATAVSIPLLNRQGIPQISASSSAVGLTSGAAGAAPGEPQKYYPTGIRTFARVVPADTVQATVQVDLQLSQDCRKTYVLRGRGGRWRGSGLELRPGGSLRRTRRAWGSRRSSPMPQATRRSPRASLRAAPTA